MFSKVLSYLLLFLGCQDGLANKALKIKYHKWQPTPVFLPGESWGRRSPVGCRLWGRIRVRHDWSDLAAAAAAVFKLDDSKVEGWDVPCGPVAKTLCFQCWGLGLDPWSGN